MDQDLGAGRTTPASDITGVILAGGRSSRFGSDKASALLLDEPLLQWVVRALETVCTELVVVGAARQPLPVVTSSRPMTLVTDDVAFEGPLAGLLIGIRSVNTSWAFVTSCDAPLLQPQLVTLLQRHASAEAVAVLSRVEGRIQPLCALYRTSSLPELKRLFDAGERRPSAIAERLESIIVDEVAVRTVDPHLLSFHNANTAADLRQIAELARYQSPG